MIIANNIKIYQGKILFNNLSFSIAKGDKIAITGNSGSGKTTLLKAILGFVELNQGEIQVFNNTPTGDKLDKIRTGIAYLPQDLNFHFPTVKNFLLYPFTFKKNKKNKPPDKAIQEILHALSLEPTILSKKPSEISGGQKQRIGLASCLLLNKTVMLLDEPTSSLDKENVKKVIAHMMTKKDTTIVASTHEPEWIQNASQVIHLGT